MHQALWVPEYMDQACLVGLHLRFVRESGRYEERKRMLGLRKRFFIISFSVECSGR